MAKMSKKLKQGLRRIGIAMVLFAVGMTLPENTIGSVVILLACYFWIGWDVLLGAFQNIRRGPKQIFDEKFLMMVASFGAIALDAYQEGVAVMLFYQVGEWFEDYAVNRSRHSISALMDIRPEYANVLRDGEVEEVDPYEVELGETIIVKPGERVPLDGVITKGTSLLDTSALTGESMPRTVEVGADIISGCINKTGVLEVRTTKRYEDSTVETILELVEDSSEKKARTEAFITRFARYYTPIVIICAALLAVLGPLVTGMPVSVWIYRALTFLVVSCPCALVLSVPLAFFGGIGGASRAGVLVKGGNYLEALAKTGVMVFDKTGTLTQGKFQVVANRPAESVAPEKLLEAAAYAEADSTHPIAAAIRHSWEKYGGAVDRNKIESIEEIAGHGIRAKVDGHEILVGNAALLRDYGRERIPVSGTDAAEQAASRGATGVFVAIDGQYTGFLAVADELKSDTVEAIAELRRQGVKKTVMLTGDTKRVGEQVARTIGIDAVYTDLLPADKVKKVEELLQQKSEKETLGYVGDGINDAPVLARADVGIAMGGLGSDAAIEAADIVLMTDEPHKLNDAIRIARKTMAIAWENIIFAIGVKVLIMIGGALGLLGLWFAVFGDVGVALLAILNSMRALSVNREALTKTEPHMATVS